jgi:hypothetical protein
VLDADLLISKLLAGRLIFEESKTRTMKSLSAGNYEQSVTLYTCVCVLNSIKLPTTWDLGETY